VSRDSYTPREIAYDRALSALRELYNEALGDDQLTKNMRLNISNATATLHNRLLDQSGLDGLQLERNVV